MTPKQLDSLKNKWQKRLKLQDWTINVKFNPLLDSNTWGRCNVWQNKYIADIDIAIPPVIDADPEADHIELVLVHELLHVIWDLHGIWPKCPDEFSAEYRFYEKCVDKMAKLLIEKHL